MSKTIDFIENNISQLRLDITVLQSDRSVFIKKIESCDKEISNKQSQIDEFNTELGAVKQLGNKDEIAKAIL